MISLEDYSKAEPMPMNTGTQTDPLMRAKTNQLSNQVPQSPEILSIQNPIVLHTLSPNTSFIMEPKSTIKHSSRLHQNIDK
jgi:hypothetical protein